MNTPIPEPAGQPASTATHPIPSLYCLHEASKDALIDAAIVFTTKLTPGQVRELAGHCLKATIAGDQDVIDYAAVLAILQRLRSTDIEAAPGLATRIDNHTEV